MDIKLLVYNVGIDKIPQGMSHTSLSRELYDRVTSSEFRRGDKTYSCDETSVFVKDYNEIISSKLIEYINDNNIDICVFQEVCTSQLYSYDFKYFLAGNYRYTNPKLNRTKALVVGTPKTGIRFDVPSFIYGGNIRKGSSKFVEYPHDYIQTVKINFGLNKILYIINIHNRVYAGNYYTFLNFICQLMGIILNIYKNDETNSNIIICGDNNSGRIGEIYSEDLNKDEIVNNFIENISQVSIRNKIKTLEGPESYIFERTLNSKIVFSLVMDALGFKHCYDNKENSNCDFKNIQEYVKNTCSTSQYSINDILYYKICNDCKIEITMEKEICNFSLTTSSHIPYILNIHFPDPVTHLINDNKPQYLIDLMEISDMLVKISNTKSIQESKYTKNIQYSPSESLNLPKSPNVPTSYQPSSNIYPPPITTHTNPTSIVSKSTTVPKPHGRYSPKTVKYVPKGSITTVATTSTTVPGKTIIIPLVLKQSRFETVTNEISETDNDIPNQTGGLQYNDEVQYNDELQYGDEYYKQKYHKYKIKYLELKEFY
ncbi:putative ORFan [Tupanvirus deep ocean]|uniref:ORFan n=2 Tax=Tupanvirus TaxID=2094720 RepID=A0AC62A708_9VIRU|nr:putative ORFan [Tupanvirus deep ocean]QKU33480.1 putative ORFan [Tupanvirus deep ocean]